MRVNQSDRIVFALDLLEHRHNKDSSVACTNYKTRALFVGELHRFCDLLIGKEKLEL